MIASGQELVLPKTVALEPEWVLHGYDGDRGFARRIRQLNLPPRVVIPTART